MALSFRRVLASLTVCALLVSSTELARASKPHSASSGFFIGPSTGQVVAIVAVLGGAGAAIGFGVYYASHHDHSLTGCAASGSSGLQLQNDGNRQTYDLLGDVAEVKPGDRVRVSGKKRKAAGNARTFLVERLSKDFGPCNVQPVNP